MTYERWVTLLHRAWHAGIRCEPHPRLVDHALCSSSRFAHVRYLVGVDRCACPARTACMHRALFLFDRPDLLPLAVDPVDVPPDDAPSVTRGVA